MPSAAEPPDASMIRKLELLQGAPFEGPREVRKKTYDDGKFYASLHEQVRPASGSPTISCGCWIACCRNIPPTYPQFRGACPRIEPGAAAAGRSHGGARCWN
jgi:hypothetical protein